MPRRSSDSAKILSLLFAIGRRIREEGKPHGKAPAYSLLHFHTLQYIAAKGKPFMHDVAAYLRVTPPAATLLIDGLVKEKLLVRSLDKKDRRSVRVALTEQGKRFLSRGIREKMKKVKNMFAAALTAKERAAFIAILEKILLEA